MSTTLTRPFLDSLHTHTHTQKGKMACRNQTKKGFFLENNDNNKKKYLNKKNKNSFVILLCAEWGLRNRWW